MNPSQSPSHAPLRSRMHTLTSIGELDSARDSLLNEHVDVIVVTFNHVAYVAECLNSILEQSHDRLQIHVIDDCSTDGTWAILEQFSREHSDRVSLCQTQSNRGVGQEASRQRYADCHVERTGGYWAVIEGDDRWIDGRKIEKQIQILRREGPCAVAVSCDTLVQGPDGQSLAPIRPAPQRWNYLDFVLGAPLLYTHPAGILWRNCFPEMVGALTKAQAEGVWPGGEWARTLSLLAESGGDIVHLDEPMALYRFHGRGIWSRLDEQERANANARLHQGLMAAVPMRYRASKAAYTASWIPAHAFRVLQRSGLLPSPLAWQDPRQSGDKSASTGLLRVRDSQRRPKLREWYRAWSEKFREGRASRRQE